MKRIEKEKIEIFLSEVDKLFPTPLSKKQNLKDYASKLSEQADIFISLEDEKIMALVAGYIRNSVDEMVYISVVATLPEAQGKGLASGLFKEFIHSAEKNNKSAVHLYTDVSNKTAIHLYEKIGFVKYECENESRPDDVHLIYYIKKES